MQQPVALHRRHGVGVDAQQLAQHGRVVLAERGGDEVGLHVGAAVRATLAVRVTRLRAKLGQAGCPGNALKSLRASGYQE